MYHVRLSPPTPILTKNGYVGLAMLLIYFHAGFLLGLFFDPEDGSDMFLRNVG
jgi:hypothetical protein